MGEFVKVILMKKAIMYGAGNIGRGFIGQLFSESGYEVVFVDINPEILQKLNSDRCYPLKIVSDDSSREIVVQNVRAIDAADTEAVAGEIASAHIMATAVGVNVISNIIKPVVKGFKLRWQRGNFSPLNVIICENLLDSNRYMENLIRSHLSTTEMQYFTQTIGLVEASIGRMVPLITPGLQEGNPLRVLAEEFCELPVDGAAFKGKIPDIKNMIPFTPFDFYIQRKLFMHNMSHAVTAYLGWLVNHEYIWQVMRNPVLKLITLRALQESALAMHKEHAIPLEKLLEHTENLLFRFENRALGDTVARVGKDPIRKLSVNDRLVGAANLCLKHGITPVYIALGIAAGYMFCPRSDQAATTLSSCIGTNSINRVLNEYSGINAGSPLCKTILEFYSDLNNNMHIENVLSKCEKLKNISNQTIPAAAGY